MNQPTPASVPAWSLRNRLILLLMVATTGLWALASYSFFQEAEFESRELFDGALRETAYLMLALVKHEMDEHGPAYTSAIIDAQDIPESQSLIFQIWDRTGALIYRSPDAPTSRLVDPGQVGYAWGNTENDSVRTFVAWDTNSQLQIQIAESVSKRRAMTGKIQQRLLWFVGAFLPITFFLIWWILMRSFAPIRWTTESVAQRTAQDLSDVELRNVPREMSPLIVALNRLLMRIRATLDMERRFTADAAHELRTPLAAIRAHAQVLRAARTPDEASEAAADIIAGVDRSSRLIEQLMILARIDQSQSGMWPDQSIDLADLVAGQIKQHAAFAQRAGIKLEATVSSVSVAAHMEDMNILLRNLIDNALRHTAVGGTVKVSCGRAKNMACLAVHDSGVGIPIAERSRIFERFYRIDDDQSFGSGLGLSIVKRIAEHYGASISVEAGLAGRGIGFVVWFRKLVDQ
jgi:signal transduction histidine kinase